ncbi:hypothetical protein ACLKA6_019800 [Drosophila palustris]
MLKIIQSLYTNNETAVWDGNNMSGWFPTNCGVKQGCLLSPLLFALFVDDITAEIPGGVHMGQLHLKVLMYADDMVMFADSPQEMQLMMSYTSILCEMEPSN